MKTLDVTIRRLTGETTSAVATIDDQGRVEFLQGLKLAPGDTWEFKLSAADTIAWLGLRPPTMHVGRDGLVARICSECGEPFADQFGSSVANVPVCPDCAVGSEA